MTPERRRLRLAGVCGIAAPVVALLFIFSAISLSPWFSWTANALSDLGVGEAALVFNSGLVLGGFLATVFAAIMLSIYQDRIRRVGGLVFLLGTISLIGIGIFSEAAGRIHFYFSVAFFVLVPISFWILGIGILRSGHKNWGVLTVVLGVVGALPWVYHWTAVAIPELLSALCFTAWSLVQGARFYLGRP
ncbi:MAG: DUF998 domain-containing protein [Candidatus Hadarchaeum sp.]|uniref:DUF998 domain-containing protein n=1 Tax=Candidatus Hadarchaeum sp. TaxID=2883567 RepID=UPI003171541D